MRLCLASPVFRNEACGRGHRVGRQLSGIRLVQIHPEVERRAGLTTAMQWLFESLHGAALFVPNTFGPRQIVGQQVGMPLYEPANARGERPIFRQSFQAASLQVLRVRIS